MIGIEKNGAASGLSGVEALAGRLDAVIDGVADKVRERFREGIEDAFVEIGVLAGHFEGDVLAAKLGDVADDAPEAAEELLDGNHAESSRRTCAVRRGRAIETRGLPPSFDADGIARMLRFEFGEGANKHGLADDQFAHQVHDGFDAGWHPRAKVASATVATAEAGGPLRAADSADQRRAWRPELQEFRKELGVRTIPRDWRVRCAKSETTEGMPAAMGDVLDRWALANGGLDDFHGSGGEVVLRAKSNDGAGRRGGRCGPVGRPAARMALLGSRRRAML